MSNHKLSYIFAILSLIATAQASCWRYGHSCWGGHGKRSGPFSSEIETQNDPDPGKNSKLENQSEKFKKFSDKRFQLVNSVPSNYDSSEENNAEEEESGEYEVSLQLLPTFDQYETSRERIRSDSADYRVELDSKGDSNYDEGDVNMLENGKKRLHFGSPPKTYSFQKLQKRQKRKRIHLYTLLR